MNKTLLMYVTPPGQDDDYIAMPLGIIYLGAIVKDADLPVECLDERVSTEEEVKEAIARNDIIGLSALTPYPVRVTITGAEGPERVSAPLVSTGFFETLRIDPLLGRHFAPDEGEPGGPDVVILSHAYWQRRFGGDRGAVGTAINMDGAPYTVIGVMQPGVRLIVDADVWRPIKRGENWASARQFHNFVLVGRLVPRREGGRELLAPPQHPTDPVGGLLGAETRHRS